jgi:beta-N-acetylhexosaminidase
MSSDPGGYFAGRTFVQEVKKRYPEALSFFADSFTGDEFIQEAVEKAKDAEVIVFALFSSVGAGKGSVDLNPKHVDVVRRASENLAPVIVISFGSPYFLRHFPGVDSYLCVYRWSAQAQEIAAKGLFGEIDIKGRLPVSIPGLYPLGHRLTLFRR